MIKGYIEEIHFGALRVLAAIIVAGIVSGCASITSGTRQKVEVSSIPSAAVVKVNGIEQGQTPLTLELERKNPPTIQLELEGYKPYEVVMETKMNPLVLFNAVFQPGAAKVDLSNGACYSLVPDHVCAKLVQGNDDAQARPNPVHFFQEVWYRPTLEKPGFLAMTDTGIVTVDTDKVTFVGKKGALEINYDKIKKVSLGKVGSDFVNEWVTVRYRDGEKVSYALFAGGKSLGWGGGGVADRIFESIKVVLDKKGMASAVEK